MASTSSVVGRVREQHMLGECLGQALAGQGSLVLVSGEAGIGKTTFVSVAANSARELGALVLTGACYDLSTTPPYGPWTNMFAQQGVDSERSPVANPMSPRLDPEQVTSQVALFEEVETFVGDLSRAQPLVMVLEDLHWSDPASLELLRYLGRRVAALPVVLIATYRSNELPRAHPLFQLLPVLVRETGAERIELYPLDYDATRALVAERYTLSDVHESRLVDYLQEHAEGNPFYVNELLRTLESERLLLHSDAGWQVHDLELAPVPPLVLQIIERRLGGLDGEARQLLELAAVIAQVVSIDVWQSASGATDSELLDAVERGIAAHVLMTDTDGSTVRFDHALTREALYAGIVPLRRRLWHRQIGETLAATVQPDPDAVAHHFLQAGDERAIDWTIQAADRAERSYAWIMAAERMETAIRLMDGIDERTRERGWLLHRLALMLRWTDPEQGIVYHEEAMQTADKIGDRTLLSISRAFRGLLLCFVGKARVGIEEMLAGAAELDEIPVDERRQLSGSVNPVMGTITAWLGLVGRIHECVRLGERFMAELAPGDDHSHPDLFTGVSDPARWILDQTANVCIGLGCACALTGQPEKAAELLTRARRHLESVAHHAMTSNVATIQLVRVVLPYDTGQLMQRRQLAVDAEEFWGRAKGALPDDSSPRMRQIPLMFVEGAWNEARALATRYPLAHSNPAMRVQGTALLASIARHQGDVDAAWRHVQTSLPYGPVHEPGELDFLNATALQRVAVELALDAGNLPLAQAWLEACDRWLDWAGALLGRADTKLLWAKFHAACDEPDTAWQRGQSALSLALEPRQPLPLLATHRFLATLAIRDRRHDVAGHHLAKALTLADACAAPFERALTLGVMAELRLATGESERARALIDEARATFGALGAQPALDRLADLDARLDSVMRVAARSTDLSPRELDVLRLIVEGKTDREIADELFISRHTVMRHVSNILNKFGVESRTAAAAHAVRHHLA